MCLFLRSDVRSSVPCANVWQYLTYRNLVSCVSPTYQIYKTSYRHSPNLGTYSSLKQQNVDLEVDNRRVWILSQWKDKNLNQNSRSSQMRPLHSECKRLEKPQVKKTNSDTKFHPLYDLGWEKVLDRA